MTKYILSIGFEWDTKAEYTESHVVRLDNSPSKFSRDPIGQ